MARAATITAPRKTGVINFPGWAEADAALAAAMQAQAAAIHAQASATVELATVVREATEILAHVATAIHQLSDAQQKFCAFLVKHRVKLIASVPIVLTAIGSVSPNVAKLLGLVLRAWGLPGS